MATSEAPDVPQPSENQQDLPQLADLAELTPSQAQRVLESALMHFRRMDEHAPTSGVQISTASLLDSGLVTAPTGEFARTHILTVFDTAIN